MGKTEVNQLQALRNGTRISRLALGKLPVDLRQVERYVKAYRRGLEAEVIAAKGEVDATDAHHIDAAAQHQQHMAVCRWILRERIDQMTTTDIERCSGTIAKAASQRNNAVKQLNLRREIEKTFAALYHRADQQEGGARSTINHGARR